MIQVPPSTSMPIPFALVENHKENIAPTDEGRSAESLLQTLNAVANTGTSRLDFQEELKRRESNLKRSIASLQEHDDPLTIYLDHIDWLKTAHPQGVNKASRSAIEACVHTFKDSDQYKSDLRYLKIWIDYARLAPNSVEIFKYMAQLGIGLKSALFYEEYSAALEAKGMIKPALDVLEHGIKRQAQPLQRLQRSRQAFQQRSAANLQAQLPETRSNQASVSGSAAPPNGRAPTVLGSGHFQQRQPVQRPGRLFEVHSDLSGSQDELHALPDLNARAAFPSSAALSRENERPSEPMAGAILPQARQASKRRFAVLEEDAVAPSKPAPVSKETLMVELKFLFQRDGNEIEEEMSLEELVLQSRRLRDVTFPRRFRGVKDPKAPTGEKENLAKMYVAPEATQTTVFANGLVDKVSRYNSGAGVTSTLDSHRYDESTMPLQSQLQPRPTAAPPRQPAPPPVENKLRFQDVVFENEEPQKLMLAPGEPPKFPDVVDAALSVVREQLLGRISQTLRHLHNYVTSQNYFGKLSALKQKKGNTELRLGTIKLNVKSKLGEGGYGVVWVAQNPVNKLVYALKGETSGLPWELYMINVTRSRINDPRVLDSLSCTYLCESYRDEQWFLMPMFRYDTILGAAHHVNALRERAQERVAMFYTIELLRVLDALHSNRVIHGDLKAENVMLRAPDTINHNSMGPYTGDGSNGWASYGVVVIDFGRAIDLDLFPPGQKFRAGWSVQAHDSVEIQNNEPWSFGIDYHGLAGIVHVLLFGRRMEVELVGGRRTAHPEFKRTWQSGLWDHLFDILLNPPTAFTPMVPQLQKMRERFQAALESNSQGLQPNLNVMLGELKRSRR